MSGRLSIILNNLKTKKSLRVIIASALFIIVLFSAISVFRFSGDELKRASKGLSTYIIDAEYNEFTKKLAARQEVDYINNAGFSIDELSFSLHANGFREGARISPVGNNELISAYPNGTSYGNIKIARVSVNKTSMRFNIGGEDAELLNIPLASSLKKNERLSVVIEYTVELANVIHRLGYNSKTVNLGNFYPSACVYENGRAVSSAYYSYGDPFYCEAANFEVTLTYPSNFILASSGSPISRKTKDGKTTAQYKAYAIRDFACVLSKDFDVIRDKADGVTINYYFYKNKNPASALKIACQSIETFNALFGKYPYDTLNVVETEFLQGGMEYSNLIYISSKIESEEEYNKVIVHEIAHQWWYGAVGSNQLSEAWLDEGLTEFSTILFYERHPEYDMTYVEAISAVTNNYSAFIKLNIEIFGQADTTMNRHLRAFKNEYEYVYMTYAKGALLFDSLRALGGDEKFFCALRLYFQRYKFKIARQDDLILCFSEKYGSDLENYITAWTEGKIVLL